MKRILSLTLLISCAYFTNAHAFLVDSTLTADNHYGLYYGNANASSLTFVGRNEKGYGGAPGTYNWSLPESYSFDTGNNDYLYVLTWDDGLWQSWIGQFQSPSFDTLYSNLSDWQFTVAHGSNPGESGNVPLLTTVQNDIATATWANPLAALPNGSYPWGYIPGISPSADFIWHDTTNDPSSSDAHYAIFRTQLHDTNSIDQGVPVPEPSSILLLALGLVLLTLFIKRPYFA